MVGRIIPAQDAAKELGLSQSTLHIKGGIHDQFKIQTDGKIVLYEIDRYLTYMELRDSTIAQVSLFIEYLDKMDSLQYTTIAIIGRVHRAGVATCALGYEKSLQLADHFREYYPFHWKRYHAYYGYNCPDYQRKELFKGRKRA